MPRNGDLGDHHWRLELAGGDSASAVGEVDLRSTEPGASDDGWWRELGLGLTSPAVCEVDSERPVLHRDWWEHAERGDGGARPDAGEVNLDLPHRSDRDGDRGRAQLAVGYATPAVSKVGLDAPEPGLTNNRWWC